jgi:hypothetical protein
VFLFWCLVVILVGAALIAVIGVLAEFGPIIIAGLALLLTVVWLVTESVKFIGSTTTIVLITVISFVTLVVKPSLAYYQKVQRVKLKKELQVRGWAEAGTRVIEEIREERRIKAEQAAEQAAGKAEQAAQDAIEAEQAEKAELEAWNVEQARRREQAELEAYNRFKLQLDLHNQS